MKISFIGAGKIGLSLGRYFKNRGLKVAGYFDSVKSLSDKAAVVTESVSFENYRKIIDESDVIFITVPDGVIKSVWGNLLNYGVKDKMIVHTSGALSSQIFSGASDKNCKVMSIHPMMTFAGGDTEIDKMETMPLTIEGDLDEFGPILEKLPNNKFTISPNKKVNYHLAGVFASNLLISVIHRAIENIEKTGLETGKEIIFPIIEKTIENIREKGTSKSITGPLERGDIDTILKHLEVQHGAEKRLYVAASLELLEIMKDREKDYSEIKKLLEGE
ncbi:DUF2520 domain-containing protein [uncultured Ilyobacter sp.]|uniref:Rossmann-like and DUF2520 domain-containing protein n=1 Tax=uncultured Ilyobacter sp. TaxID=544433 RepID=UPI0029C834A5|nr:DUF2520 domain-containing protein [uncultured Ilyobacter sp.]